MAQDWHRFVTEALCPNADTNFRLPFEQLTRRYGRAYIEYLKAAYAAKDELSDKEFCRLNHCPLEFLQKIINV